MRTFSENFPNIFLWNLPSYFTAQFLRTWMLYADLPRTTYPERKGIYWVCVCVCDNNALCSLPFTAYMFFRICMFLEKTFSGGLSCCKRSSCCTVASRWAAISVKSVLKETLTVLNGKHTMSQQLGRICSLGIVCETAEPAHPSVACKQCFTQMDAMGAVCMREGR